MRVSSSAVSGISFISVPRITLTDLISGESECVPSERRHESTEVPVPMSDRCLEEYDITSKCSLAFQKKFLSFVFKYPSKQII